MKQNIYEIRLRHYASLPARTITAASPGKAKYLVYLDLGDIYESFADFLADIDSVHKICARVPMNTDMFELTKEIRDVPFACLGMKVMVGNRLGTIVGANDSANFDVQLENGIIANCHPRSNIKYFNRQNELIQTYNKKEM